jgi:hypothetical protein
VSDNVENRFETDIYIYRCVMIDGATVDPIVMTCGERGLAHRVYQCNELLNHRCYQCNDPLVTVYCSYQCNDPEGGTAYGTTAGINVTTGLDAGTNAMTGGECEIASRCCHVVRRLESALRERGEVSS